MEEIWIASGLVEAPGEMVLLPRGSRKKLGQQRSAVGLTQRCYPVNGRSIAQ
jgi:hypothetical protein